MKTLEINSFLAVTLGLLVYFLGGFLTRHVAFLRNYNIPEPVSGGLAAAVATGVLYALGTEVVFDLEARDMLLVIFFTTIGLNARFADLKAGGKMLGVLLVLTVGFMVLQNTVALLGVMAFDQPRPVGVLLGTASLIGGHGTAIAWGPTIGEQTGFEAAAEIGIAAATLGLVCASVVGGPIAKFLINRNQLEAGQADGPVVGLPYDSDDDKTEAQAKTRRPPLDHVDLMRAMLAVNVAIILGYLAHQVILDLGLKLPLFVPCLLVGIVLSNTVPPIFPKLPWPARTPALAVISDYSLMVFLSMSLMSMKLWTLAGLGGPLVGVLALQVAAAVLFILFVVFPLMGRDYNAAVLGAGFAGFTLGATPTAIANMSAVTKRYGPAPLAFIMLPLVSAFFVDLANAFLIKFFTSL
ncbi:sodium/glutamate symporter [Algisphaera agarilytica]|uniref:Sodium/glutamate symporter n=1 Tax=Algisphaera agarilytica TaxID=1385975 RepID=A0A7X0H398_9BACT|nr:sodium/glutamate symporter [Algisphaera agarilytica]MBB6428487.1 ESS family glutamate:Na+ symporter [Algisphaera agarilytica]